MIQKISKKELQEVKKYLPEELQSLEKTLNNLCFFLKKLLEIFPNNDFAKPFALYTFQSVGEYLKKIDPDWSNDTDLRFNIAEGELIDISFFLYIPQVFFVNIDIPCSDTYFARINLQINCFGKVSFEFWKMDDFDSYHIGEMSLFYELYFDKINQILSKMKLSSDSNVEIRKIGDLNKDNGHSYNFSSMDGTLTLKDTLLVMKTIHKNGFSVGEIPKI